MARRVDYRAPGGTGALLDRFLSHRSYLVKERKEKKEIKDVITHSVDERFKFADILKKIKRVITGLSLSVTTENDQH